MRLIQGDCLTVMQKLADEGVKVDLVLTDPPYGTTACKWDSVIPFDEMWECINQITHDKTPILLFGSQPSLSNLIMSNIKNFKFNFIWDKHCVSNPLLSKKRPLKVHEEIGVFYKKQPYYNPQKVPAQWGVDRTRTSDKAKRVDEVNSDCFGEGYRSLYYVDDGTRLPQSIINNFPSQMKECVNNYRVHPTQKPVELLKWLIENYTPPGDIVLDFTMGSGSTGVACYNTDRDFIGIELDEGYYNIANDRIKKAMGQSKLDVFNKNKVKV